MQFCYHSVEQVPAELLVPWTSLSLWFGESGETLVRTQIASHGRPPCIDLDGSPGPTPY